MTYREVILKLLKTRGDVVCVEKHLKGDFPENGNTGESFKQWCEMHDLEFEKLNSYEPSRVHLKKKLNAEDN